MGQGCDPVGIPGGGRERDGDRPRLGEFRQKFTVCEKGATLRGTDCRPPLQMEGIWDTGAERRDNMTVLGPGSSAYSEHFSAVVLPDLC